MSSNLSPQRERQISLIAEVDPKTVRRALAGGTVRPGSRARIERALDVLRAAGVDIEAERGAK